MTSSEQSSRGRLVVIDWGIGGLDALAGLARVLPRTELIYRSDSGFTPYGKVAPERLAERVRRVALDGLGRVRTGDRLVIACNAASTIIERLDIGVPVHGVIVPGAALLAAVAAEGATSLAVLGGERTIASGAHSAYLRSLGYELELQALVAQPLSAHIEAGRLEGAELMADLEPLVHRLRSSRCQAALLACTHYPALTPLLKRLLPGVLWLDPVRDPTHGLVSTLAHDLNAEGGKADERRQAHVSDVFSDHAALSIATSGAPHDLVMSARLAFGFKVNPKQVQTFSAD